MPFRSALPLATAALLLGGSLTLAHSLDSSPPLIAQQVNPVRGRGGWLQDLNLTPTQVNQMNQIRARYRGRLSQQGQSLRQAQQQLQQMLGSSTASRSDLMAQHRRVQTLRQQLSNTQFESMLAMREVLTPEQRAKLAQQMQQRRDGWRGRMRQRSDAPGL